MSLDIHVNGGSGFLGQRVVSCLVARGHRVSCLCRSQPSRAQVVALGARALQGDLDAPPSVEAAFLASGAEALVNLTSLDLGHAPNIVACAEKAGMQRVVLTSTTAIFTTLASPFRPIRTSAEEAIRRSGLRWTIIRPTMIYGRPGDRNLERLLRLLQRSPVVLLPGRGERLQQPVHVDDAADGIVAAIERPAAAGGEYDLAGPAPLSFRQLVEEAADALGRRPRLLSAPLAPAMRLLQLYEQIARHPRIRAEQLARLTEDKVYDTGPARRDLDYEPRSFREGIRQEAALLRSLP